MKQSRNSINLAFSPVADAVSKLLHPHAEIVIHSLKTQRIAAIYNSFSKRKVGDESLLEEDHDFNTGPNVLGPYPKTNWDGRKLKSITAVLRDQKNQAEFLMCINLDVSAFEKLKNIAEAFIGLAIDTQPKFLFKDDWREKINLFIDQHLRNNNKSIRALTKEEQQNLVHMLHQEGAFQGRNAAEYIGQVLNLSRATVYNYLRIQEEK